MFLRLVWFFPTFVVIVRRFCSGIKSKIVLFVCFLFVLDLICFDDELIGKSSSTSSRQRLRIDRDIFFCSLIITNAIILCEFCKQCWFICNLSAIWDTCGLVYFNVSFQFQNWWQKCRGRWCQCVAHRMVGTRRLLLKFKKYWCSRIRFAEIRSDGLNLNICFIKWISIFLARLIWKFKICNESN